MHSVSILVAFAVVTQLYHVDAQVVYAPVNGTTTRPCSSYASAKPTYVFSSFGWTVTETVRTATSVSAPTGPAQTYAHSYDQLSHPVPNISTTTWGSFFPNNTPSAPTDTADPYGQAAWTALWQRADIKNFTSIGLYTTTVSPTPVPKTDLVLPPRDYFGPTDCYNFLDG
ncbi:MAG: hypothetical protein M1834_007924, partial [Cirrosporium novae-zelandiae]